MKSQIILGLLFGSAFFVSCEERKVSDTKTETSFAGAEIDIRRSLDDWAAAFKQKDHQSAINLFDSSSTDIMLIGSDSSEVFRGYEQISAFLKTLFAQPFSLSWQYRDISITVHQRSAWASVDATLIVTDNAIVSNIHYRFMIVLSEKNEVWKWRAYFGSEPKPL